MRCTIPRTILLGTVFCCFLGMSTIQVQADTAAPSSTSNRECLSIKGQTDPLTTPNNRMSLAPVRFQENRGQIADSDGKVRNDIRFMAYAPGARIYFRSDGISYVFTRQTDAGAMAADRIDQRTEHRFEDTPLPTESEVYRLDMQLEGANPFASIRGIKEVPGTVNFYYPHCPDGILGVREFEKIVYENVYENIDFELFHVNGRVKYNFVVHPGGDVAHIKMRYQGDVDIALTGGALDIALPVGGIREDVPYTYMARSNQEVVSRFVVDEQTVSFKVDAYNSEEDLIIDPWATYYGGDGHDYGHTITVDSDDNILVAGMTRGGAFPVYNAYQPISGGSDDAFVIKFDSTGTRLWATYYGGSSLERAHGIAVDQNDNVFLAGITRSTDFPVTSGAYQLTNAGYDDAYVAKFSSEGSMLWSTYYGGAIDDGSWSAAICPNGNVIIVGGTRSADLPVTNNALYSTLSGPYDILIAQFSGAGALVFASYYGGTDSEAGRGVDVNSSGMISIAGTTSSTDFPVLNPLQSSHGGSQADGYILCFNPSWTLQWSTYFGGSGSDELFDVAISASGNVSATGFTSSVDFPLLNPQQNVNAGGYDAIVGNLSSNGGGLWTTYLGGTGNDEGYEVAFDSDGDVVVTGTTNSIDLPVLNAQQSQFGGYSDALIFKFNSSGGVEWGTYYGGDSFEYGRAITTDAVGNVVSTGETWSGDFPISNAHQSMHGGGIDAYVIRMDPDGRVSYCTPPIISCPSDVSVTADPGVCGATIAFEATATGDPGIFVYTVGTTPITSPYTFPVGSTSVNAVVTNPCGSDNCSFTVTVNDEQPPTVLTQNIAVPLADGTASIAAAQVDGGSNDNCGIASMTVSPAEFDCSDIGANEVVLTVTDIYGNTASATAIVTVEGSIPEPTIMVWPSPAALGGAPNTIYLGYGEQSVTLTAAGGVNYTWSPSPYLSCTDCSETVFSPQEEGVYTISVASTNGYGCTGTASVTITVFDWRCGNNRTKVMLCHNEHTICVAPDAVPAHLDHGDYLGACLSPKERASVLSSGYSLEQNYPNPFNPVTMITFVLPADEFVAIKLFDQNGNLVRTILEGNRSAGTHRIEFDASGLPSATYLYRLETPQVTLTKSMILLK